MPPFTPDFRLISSPQFFFAIKDELCWLLQISDCPVKANTTMVYLSRNDEINNVIDWLCISITSGVLHLMWQTGSTLLNCIEFWLRTVIAWKMIGIILASYVAIYGKNYIFYLASKIRSRMQFEIRKLPRLPILERHSTQALLLREAGSKPN